ncbi:MAG: polyprenyl synthetase family protein [Bacillota bacterium]
MGFDLATYLTQHQQLVNEALAELLPVGDTFPPVIHEAMRYSVLGGGKRLRPILALAAAESVGAEAGPLLPAICALECIHAYSLIHDDLPAMDDDDLRHGLPANHRVYGEAVAILAGDALLTYAFRLLCSLKEAFPAELVLQIIEETAIASGSTGLVGGQTMDILAERQQLDFVPTEALEYIHRHKTGDLLRLSVRVGAILGGASADQLEALTRYAERIGVAFQITDDLLDVYGDETKLGKRVGKDAPRGKLTYPGVYGTPAAERQVQHLLQSAVDELQALGPTAEPLRQIARFLAQRDH